ncbi:hypothetical protein QMK38_06165 [Lysinibacillus fusiformis]|nr:hypothetical protein [Lysinibacillus fusiformis]
MSELKKNMHEIFVQFHPIEFIQRQEKNDTSAPETTERTACKDTFGRHRKSLPFHVFISETKADRKTIGNQLVF